MGRNIIIFDRTRRIILAREWGSTRGRGQSWWCVKKKKVRLLSSLEVRGARPAAFPKLVPPSTFLLQPGCHSRSSESASEASGFPAKILAGASQESGWKELQRSSPETSAKCTAHGLTQRSTSPSCAPTPWLARSLDRSPVSQRWWPTPLLCPALAVSADSAEDSAGCLGRSESTAEKRSHSLRLFIESLGALLAGLYRLFSAPSTPPSPPLRQSRGC